MRLPLAIVAFACAGSAAAEPMQDRYGPPRKAAPPQTRPYEGRLLGWAGKAAQQAPQPAQVAARPEPQPLARPTAPIAPTRASRAATPPPAAAALPQSLYDAPAAPVPPPAPQMAQAPSAPAPQRGAAPSRLYSLHREYGMAPDAAPAMSSQTSYVLIGPPDGPDLPAEEQDGEAPARKPPVDARLF